LGDVREGLVNADGSVDIGLDLAPKLKGKVAAGRRVTVTVTSTSPPEVELIPREKIKEYWGYRVELKSVGDVFSDPAFRVKVATSKFGVPLAQSRASLEASFSRTDSIMLIFGSPSKGLYDIVGRDLDRRVDFVVNLFPEQHVETVRTEEAIFAGLNLLSILTV
jgi:predicted SPOUT superfamily RNA methylase MTH1